MRRLLTDIILGILLTVFIGLGIDQYENNRQSRNNFAYKRWYIDNHSEDINTLLIGNSYFENSINPYELGDSTFDCAISGRWIYYDMCLIRQIIGCMPNLKTVIYPMSYVTPYVNPHKHFKKTDWHYLTNYSRKMHIPYDRFPRNFICNSYFLSGLWGAKYDQVEPIISCDSLGYARLDGSFNKWLEDLSEISRWVNDNRYLQIDTTEYVGYLKSIASICESHNIRFIIVSPPLHSMYNEVTEIKGHLILNDIIRSVGTHYSIEYKNYFFDEDFRADSLFSNYSHLNHAGATKFAKWVKRDFDL